MSVHVTKLDGRGTVPLYWPSWAVPSAFYVDETPCGFALFATRDDARVSPVYATQHEAEIQCALRNGRSPRDVERMRHEGGWP